MIFLFDEVSKICITYDSTKNSQNLYFLNFLKTVIGEEKVLELLACFCKFSIVARTY